MRHSGQQAEHRSAFDGIDPVAMIGVPLAILLLGFLALRATVAAIFV
jgi:hypothetical protein